MKNTDDVKASVKKLDNKPKSGGRKKEKKPTDKLADKTVLTKFLQGVFGDAQKKILKRLWKKARSLEHRLSLPSRQRLTQRLVVLPSLMADTQCSVK